MTRVYPEYPKPRFKPGDKVRTTTPFCSLGQEIPVGSVGEIEDVDQNTGRGLYPYIVRFDNKELGSSAASELELDFIENGIQRAIKCLK